jgi:hypothetical protein
LWVGEHFVESGVLDTLKDDSRGHRYIECSEIVEEFWRRVCEG